MYVLGIKTRGVIRPHLPAASESKNDDSLGEPLVNAEEQSSWTLDDETVLSIEFDNGNEQMNQCVVCGVEGIDLSRCEYCSVLAHNHCIK